MQLQTLTYLCVLLTACGLAASPQLRADDNTDLVQKIDTAIARATKFLAERQSPDGAWRSDVYSAFKEGDALTPLVLTAVLPLPLDAQTEAVKDRRLDWLAKFSERTFADKNGARSLNYPAYTAANAVLALHQSRRAEEDVTRQQWLQLLRGLQFSELQGWENDVRRGGWGYGSHVPKKDDPIGPPDEPNLSATRFAIVALSAAGGTYENDKSLRLAHGFLERCHNFRLTAKSKRDAFYVDEETGDGGYFFLPTDPSRNKAGALASAPGGVASYGSATADGLLAAEHVVDHQLLVDYWGIRACNWFQKNFDAEKVPGQYTADREGNRNGVYYYYMAALAQGLAIPSPPYFKDWPDQMTVALLKRQQNDGSWKNEIVDQREDDPIVATAFAIQALTACRSMLSQGKSFLTVQAEDGGLICHARDATCHGEKLQFEPQPQKNTLGYWVNEKDWASWKLDFAKPGEFEVVVLQGCGAGQGGSEVEVSIGDAKLQFTVEDTGHFQNFKSRSIGKLTIAAAGEHELIVKPIRKVKAAVMDLRQVHLKPQ